MLDISPYILILEIITLYKLAIATVLYPQINPFFTYPLYTGSFYNHLIFEISYICNIYFVATIFNKIIVI